MEQGLGSPDITLLCSVFGQGGMNTGILFHKFPLYSLLKGTSQNFVNRTNRAGRNVLMLTLSTHMIFDLIGIPFLKAGNNDTPFVVYQNDFKEILMR